MALIFLLAIVLLSAGFAKVMARCVNWLCAQRLPRKFVAADKGLNLCLIVAYPIVLFCGLGWCGPRLMFGGSSREIGLAWWPMIALGALGFLWLVDSTIRYWRYRPPECELSVVGEIVDLRVEANLQSQAKGQSWRETLVGSRGRLRKVALLPGNEQFSIDISTKTYQLARLPTHWNGLSIVQLTDFHFCGGVKRAYFEMVCDRVAALQPDIFVFSGDLLDDQRLLNWLPETLGRLKAPLGQYFVLGNHDWYQDADAIRREFARLGWTDLTERFCVIRPPNQPAHAPVILCGDETPWMGTHADLTNAPPDAFRILVSHTPDNITWARRHGIDLMLAGHTHGGQIRLPILGPVYSPSQFDCRFASGVFWLDPTLMYVSRGISGREPIRYNCPPELTKLVLKPAKG